jgi:hypothetical protein
MECPIHAKSKPKFTQAYSFGLVTGLFFISSWTAQFLFQMISERNEATQHAERFTWFDFLPALLFLQLRELAVKGFATHLASGDLAMFYFSVSSLQGSDDRREAHPPTVRTADRPAQFDYQEEEEVQRCGLNSQTNAQRLTRNIRSQVVTPSPEHHQPLRDALFAPA